MLISTFDLSLVLFSYSFIYIGYQICQNQMLEGYQISPVLQSIHLSQINNTTLQGLVSETAYMLPEWGWTQ